MPKFSAKNIEFKDYQQAIFGTDDDAYISWDGGTDQLVVSTTLSGIDPTEDGHLVTKRYIDDEITTISGILNDLDTTTSGFGNVYLFPADVSVGNPPSPTYSTTDPVLAYMFDDNKEENIYGGFSIPGDCKADSNIEIKVGYMTNEAQTGTNTCRWTLTYHTYVSGNVYTAKTSTVYSTDSTLPNNAASGYFIISSFSSKLTYNDTNNPFEKDTAVQFMLERAGKHANDTMTGDAALMQIIFRYETEAT